MSDSLVNKQKFYITTAINYTNGSPHIGHAYEIIMADILARYHRISGDNTFFLTGTDEHGQKIMQMANDNNTTPISICDKYSLEFKAMNAKLNISTDHFIRTTDKIHIDFVQNTIDKLLTSGDIYYGIYSGWYNVREETFVTESEALITDYKDPLTGNDLVKMNEETYFFKLSKYKNQIINHINNNLNFILPFHYRDIILNRLNSDELHDLSISRSTFDWGIKFRNDQRHILYVWFDALLNYISGIVNQLDEFWPPNVQIIGKDILWFHSVIWSGILFALNMQLPTTIFAHGFIHDDKGYKMSKSLNNVVDPKELLNKYSSDSLRAMFVNKHPFGNDINFQEDTIIATHNSDIANTIGNLVVRCSTLLNDNNNQIPNSEPETIYDIQALFENVDKHFTTFNIHAAYECILMYAKTINHYLTQKAPWKIKATDDQNFSKRGVIMRSVLENIYILSHLLYPFISDTSNQIFSTLMTPPVLISELTNKNLIAGTIVKKFEFKKILSNNKDNKTNTNINTNVNTNVNKNISNQHIFTMLDIRVGFVINAYCHPNSTKLYCEEIDVGEEQPRQIVSGIQQKVSLDKFVGQKVLVVCNLKPVKLAGYNSSGMVLCASKDEQVELIYAPSDSQIGQRIYLTNIDGIPLSAAQVKNKKILEIVLDKLWTNESAVATYDNLPLETSHGVCRANTLMLAPIR